MCGRYTLLTEDECAEIERIVEAVDQRYGGEARFAKRGEIFPTNEAPVLVPGRREEVAFDLEAALGFGPGKGGERSGTAVVPELVVWGFPRFGKAEALSPGSGAGRRGGGSGVVINARSETVEEKAMFRRSFEERRCVVPAAGFFEWKRDADLAAGRGREKKVKYLFRQAPGRPLYMAGLIGEFAGERRFVILTTAANASMEEVHDRMPVLLLPEQVEPWLTDLRSAAQLLRELPPPLVKTDAEEERQLSFGI